MSPATASPTTAITATNAATVRVIVASPRGQVWPPLRVSCLPNARLSIVTAGSGLEQAGPDGAQR